MYGISNGKISVMIFIYLHTDIRTALVFPFRNVGLDTATAVEGYTPVTPLGAPECQPFTTRLLKVMRLKAHEESLPACPKA
jgi:hypothetical protein